MASSMVAEILVNDFIFYLDWCVVLLLLLALLIWLFSPVRVEVWGDEWKLVAGLLVGLAKYGPAHVLPHRLRRCCKLVW